MFLIFLFGMLFSFLGYTFPSVLNMTALKIRLRGNKRDFNYFTLGVLLIVFFQAYISVYLTKYIANNTMLIALIEKGGIVVLLFLSVYFYQQNKKEKQQVKSNKKKKNSFFTGIFLSTLNMFAIPFFSGTAALLMGFNLMNFDTISILYFVVGSVLGTYYILHLYGKYAYKIEQRTGNMSQNINLVLSFITGGFALFTFLKFVL